MARVSDGGGTGSGRVMRRLLDKGPGVTRNEAKALLAPTDSSLFSPNVKSKMLSLVPKNFREAEALKRIRYSQDEIRSLARRFGVIKG